MQTLLRTAAVAACVLFAAPAIAGAEAGLTPNSSTPWMVAPDTSAEVGPTAIAGAAGGEVLVAGEVVWWTMPAGGDPGDEEQDNRAVIRRYSASGQFVRQTVVAKSGTWPVYITDVAASPDGAILYAAAWGGAGDRANKGVLRVDADTGAVLGSFGGPGSTGSVKYVEGVEVAPDGDVYVHSLGTDDKVRVTVFGAAGDYKSQFIAPDMGEIYVDEFGGRSAGAIALDPTDMSVLVRSEVVCAEDSWLTRIDRYSATGALVESFALPASYGFAVRPTDGAIFLQSNDRVTALDARGRLIASETPANPLGPMAFSQDGSRLWHLPYHGSSDTARVVSFTVSTPSVGSGAPAPAVCPGAPTGGGGEQTGGGSPAIEAPISLPAPKPVDLTAEGAAARRVVAKLTPVKLAGRGYSRRFTADRAGTATEEILVKGKVVARGKLTFSAAGFKTLKVKPTTAARKALKGKSVKVVVRTTFKPASGGTPVVVKRTLTLKRR